MVTAIGWNGRVLQYCVSERSPTGAKSATSIESTGTCLTRGAPRCRIPFLLRKSAMHGAPDGRMKWRERVHGAPRFSRPSAGNKLERARSGVALVDGLQRTPRLAWPGAEGHGEVGTCVENGWTLPRRPCQSVCPSSLRIPADAG